MAADNKNVERKIDIEPAMNGNAFRVMLEHDNGHATGKGTAGKFDFWAVPNPTYKPLDLRAEPQRAMMDLDASFTAKGYWDNGWKNPRLDSRTGVHNAKG
jgi:hypothetical protein